MQKVFISFKMAFRDAKTNLFHTILSVLGIVIGVAALVGILSLIDGMEKYAHQQISSTTILEAIIITTSTVSYEDNIKIAKQDYAYFTYPLFTKLLKKVGGRSKGYMRYQESGYIYEADSNRRKGVFLNGIIDTWHNNLTLVAGRFISKDDLSQKDSVVVLNQIIAQHLTKGKDYKNLIGQPISYKNGNYTIIGIISTQDNTAKIYVPITLISPDQIQSKPPEIRLIANSVEDVSQIKEDALTWISQHFKESKSDFKVMTNEFRVEQANQGFLVFRIVMGLIVGISVLVGGIGVMNVLLISVNERTVEIGVRKAVGAKPKDIVLQFLTESITISAIGSILGLILGVLFTMGAVPLIKHFTKIPFQAAYTLNTMLIISIVAIIVGIVFGTYPAIKASKLDPVEAIRRE
ncbi:MAG: ABC transporter permease [Cyclobacteriaceae bacterium]|nr:ABC transporter permease [Cyclobacteriaceae bacterium]